MRTGRVTCAPLRILVKVKLCRNLRNKITINKFSGAIVPSAEINSEFRAVFTLINNKCAEIVGPRGDAISKERNNGVDLGHPAPSAT
jgi:hypothetical protein